MLPIFNEKAYAQKMNEGWAKDRGQEDKRKYTFRELLIYAKWLRAFHSNYSEEEQDKLLYTGIVSFCDQLQLYFDIDIDYYMVENLIKKSKQFKLREHNPSYISKQEWSDILSIPSEEARKLYFAYLILGKFNRNNPVINVNKRDIEYEDTRLKLRYTKDIYKYAGVTFKKVDKENDPKIVTKPLKVLYDMGLIDVKMSRKGLYIILNKADLDIKKEDIYLTITHYSDIKKYYKYGLGQKGYKICQKCGRAFYTRSSYVLTCPDCQEETPEHTYAVCTSCGVRFEKNSKYNGNVKMCPKCYKEYRRKYVAEKVKISKKKRGR